MLMTYLFVDMNAYFASVEQQLRPELRGKPVAVVPVEAETTACIAASYEAKKFGIKTGTHVSDARRLCPGIRIIAARPQVYVQMHHKIVAAVEAIVPVTTVMSVDEMICRLLGDHAHIDRAQQLAAEIKESIHVHAGEIMRCSIGIAPNGLLAKVAADMKKPNGLTVIRREELPTRLHELQLTDFPGIGSRMEKRLHLAGIATVERLCQASIAELSRIWGSKFLGAVWYHRLRGADIRDAPTQRHSLGHSRVLEPEFRREDHARAILIRLLHKAAARLRHVGYYTRELSLSVSYVRQKRWRTKIRLPACQDTLTLIRLISPLWAKKPAGTPLKVGLVLGDLVHERNVPRSLFEPDNKLLELAKAVDRANRQFGRYAVYFGGMHGKGGAVSTRIAFGAIPDLGFGDC